MSDYLSTTTYLPPIEGFGQRAAGREPDVPHPNSVHNDQLANQ